MDTDVPGDMTLPACSSRARWYAGNLCSALLLCHAMRIGSGFIGLLFALGLVTLDTGGLYHFPPLPVVVPEVDGKIVRGAAIGLRPVHGKALLDVGAAQDPVEFRVEPGDDRRRQSSRAGDSPPLIRFETGQGGRLRHGGQVRRDIETRQ